MNLYCYQHCCISLSLLTILHHPTPYICVLLFLIFLVLVWMASYDVTTLPKWTSVRFRQTSEMVTLWLTM